MFSCPLRQAAHIPQVTKGYTATWSPIATPVGQRAVGVDDGAGELVAQHGGEGDVLLLAALIDPNVGAAHQRRVHPEQHVAGLQMPGSILARSAGHWAGAARPGGSAAAVAEPIGAAAVEVDVVVTADCLSRWRYRSVPAADAQVDLRADGAQRVQRGGVGVVVGDQPPPRGQRRPVVELVGAPACGGRRPPRSGGRAASSGSSAGSAPACATRCRIAGAPRRRR